MSDFCAVPRLNALPTTKLPKSELYEPGNIDGDGHLQNEYAALPKSETWELPPGSALTDRREKHPTRVDIDGTKKLNANYPPQNEKEKQEQVLYVKVLTDTSPTHGDELRRSQSTFENPLDIMRAKDLVFKKPDELERHLNVFVEDLLSNLPKSLSDKGKKSKVKATLEENLRARLEKHLSEYREQTSTIQPDALALPTKEMGLQQQAWMCKVEKDLKRSLIREHRAMHGVSFWKKNSTVGENFWSDWDDDGKNSNGPRIEFQSFPNNASFDTTTSVADESVVLPENFQQLVPELIKEFEQSAIAQLGKSLARDDIRTVADAERALATLMPAAYQKVIFEFITGMTNFEAKDGKRAEAVTYVLKKAGCEDPSGNHELLAKATLRQVFVAIAKQLDVTIEGTPQHAPLLTWNDNGAGQLYFRGKLFILNQEPVRPRPYSFGMLYEARSSDGERFLVQVPRNAAESDDSASRAARVHFALQGSAFEPAEDAWPVLRGVITDEFGRVIPIMDTIPEDELSPMIRKLGYLHNAASPVEARLPELVYPMYLEFGDDLFGEGKLNPNALTNTLACERKMFDTFYNQKENFLNQKLVRLLVMARGDSPPTEADQKVVEKALIEAFVMLARGHLPTYLHRDEDDDRSFLFEGRKFSMTEEPLGTGGISTIHVAQCDDGDQPSELIVKIPKNIAPRYTTPANGINLHFEIQERCEKLGQSPAVKLWGTMTDEYGCNIAILEWMPYGDLESVVQKIHAIKSRPEFKDATKEIDAVIGDFIGKALMCVVALHELDIVHFDIKLANFLIGPDLEVKISDFDTTKADGDRLATRTNFAGTPSYSAYQGIADRLLGLHGKECEWLDVLALSFVFHELLLVASPEMRAAFDVVIKKMNRSTISNSKPSSPNVTPARLRSPASSPDGSADNTPTRTRARRAADSPGIRFTKPRAKAKDIAEHYKYRVLFDSQTSAEFKELERAVLEFDVDEDDTDRILNAVSNYRELKATAVRDLITEAESLSSGQRTSRSIPKSIEMATTLYKLAVMNNEVNHDYQIKPEWLNEYASALNSDVTDTPVDLAKSLNFAAIMFNTLPMLSSPKVDFGKFIESAAPAFFGEDGSSLLYQVIATHNSRRTGKQVERDDLLKKITEIERMLTPEALKNAPGDFDAKRYMQMRELLKEVEGMWPESRLLK